MSSNKNLITFLRILIKWQKMILIVVAVAAVGSIIIALLLPNYYKSEATFLPSNLSAYDRSTLFSTEGAEKEIDYFGNKNDIERILAFANSSPLIQHVINHFKLYDHYDIDTTSSTWRLKVRREFDGNYKAIKSEKGYVEVSVLDTDKELAAEIVNHILAKIDEANSAVFKNRNRQILVTMENQMAEKSRELQGMTDSLSSFNDTTNIKYKVLHRQQQQVLENYNNLLTLVDQYRGTVNNEFSSIYIIEAAQPAIKKSKPVRWLIVVSATLIALFLAVIGAVVIEQYKDIKYDLKNA